MEDVIDIADIAEYHRQNEEKTAARVKRMLEESRFRAKERRETICIGCEYACCATDGDGQKRYIYCNYLTMVGHSRPCAAVDCVAEGIWKAKGESKDESDQSG